MYASFCSAANSLSQLYTQAMNHQKPSFQAGERHGLEKLYQWIWRQQEGGSRVTTTDIVNYIQNEVDYCGEEPSMSSRAPVQYQHSQPALQTFMVPSGSSCQAGGQGTRPEQCDQQSKNPVFSNALSSPVRRGLQFYHMQGGYFQNGGLPSGTGSRSNEPNFLQLQNRDSNPPGSNDSTMDMHAD